FRPWILLDRLDDLRHLGSALGAAGAPNATITYRELSGPGALRYLVSGPDGRTLAAAILRGVSQRTRQPTHRLRDLSRDTVFPLPPDEQYLVATGRTYFRDLPFEDLRRLQLDLETTGLDPDRHRIFLISIRDPSGSSETIEIEKRGNAGEADLIERLVRRI